MREGRPPSPHLQQLTDLNRDALPYYREACRILEGIPCNCKPEDMQNRHKAIIRSRMGDADERLAAEVRRVYEHRRKNAKTT